MVPPQLISSTQLQAPEGKRVLLSEVARQHAVEVTMCKETEVQLDSLQRWLIDYTKAKK